MEFLRNLFSFRLPSTSDFRHGVKTLLVPHYIFNIILSTLFFILKTTPRICDTLFEDCSLQLREWEWLTFLGCIIVMKNRKQATFTEYIGTACMFGKTLNLVLFFQYGPRLAIIYFVLCLLQFVFLPQPQYSGPEFVTYFRGPHLKNEIQSDKRVTWMICFYAAWSPSCVTVAPMFSEISADYHLDNFKFGKMDVSRYSDVAEHYNISTSSFSKQLPTIVLFEDGKEKMRRPAVSAKGTVVKYAFTKDNIIKDFELNELYGKCKKTLPKKQKQKETQKNGKGGKQD